jgi:hypothetical protein
MRKKIMATINTVESLFEGKAPQLKLVYDRLVARLKEFGPVREGPKQTTIHLEKNSAFAGIHFRKNHLNLEFRIDYKIDDPRITHQMQLSARRFEHTVKLERESDIDSQLLRWLKDAYDLSK